MATAQQGVTVILKDNQMVFACHSDTATTVFLTGSFNNWSPTATLMTGDNAANGPRHYRLLPDATNTSSWWTTSGVVSRDAHTKAVIARIAS